MNVMIKIMTGIYQANGCIHRLNNTFTVEIINAVMDESRRGDRFLVSSTDIA